MCAVVQGASPDRTPTKLRHYAVALTQGAAVLIIEVLGARMLTPYFGTSHYVWTAQITTTLVALAAGYAAGARIAPLRRARVVRWALFLAGAYLGLSPLVVERISYVSYHVPLPVGALATSATLFALPLAALAAVSPCLVGEGARLAAGSTDGELTQAGEVAGRYAALSTAGSVVGVLFVAYVCIPLVASSTTMFGLSLFLIACSSISIDGARLGRQWSLLMLSAFASTSTLATYEATRPFRVARHVREIDRAYSPYSTLQVWRSTSSEVLSLSTNLTFQNDYDPTLKQGVDPFAYVLLELIHNYGRAVHRALIVGLGVGIVPRELERDGIASTVFELDPVVPQLAERYFQADLSKLELQIGDGRGLLYGASADAYDVLVLDAFHGDSTPSHLLSQEAFRAMSRVLHEDGILVANLWTDLERDDKLMPLIIRTMQSVFHQVRVHDARLGNYYVVATNGPALSSPRVVDEHAMPARVIESVRKSLLTYYDAARDIGPVLSDDFNPADTIAARYFEFVRRVEAGHARPN